ncbi:family 31 glycosyltransferase [Cryphonectria parasitica EP155]|uniref:N-acetylgalactosaminide beta-1,3-galactosyltransferase n=1 Tax=Cryphonectria parasitica (strain ATCC 38755 / EP155) TaxID=660469 RepID=A0A9P4Y299_CRYP1|nr:family 31 glycosyltransferase [Cryphonectria parasitica EP155]KAF3765667.1 family 31 glycosyltransferase [Cryphonectria parasitica EP155]
MTSHRSFTIVLFAFISAVVLLITAKRLDRATWDAENFNTDHLNEFIRPATDGTSDTGNAFNASATPVFTTTATVTVTALDTEKSTGNAIPGNKNKDGSKSSLSPARDPACDGFPDTSGILLVMKTGATESYDKLPVQIMTALKCLPDFLLFSDLDQRIGGHHVRDSLDSVLSEAKEDNDDFDLYRLQQECAVDQDNCVKVLEAADSAGWNLDKYKNIHMAEKSYRLRPDYDWYVFVDADTYVSWPNMVYALRRLDPAKERYFGVPTVIGDKLFAHGGSGYVVSRGAMREFAGKNPGIANKYDVEIKDNCCGDFMFAQALNATIGILVEGFWPLSNGEKPFTTPFGHNTWCHAVGMMHHMNSEEISSFWDFERKRYRTNHKPLVFSEVYDEFISSKLRDVREDWDNASDGWFYIDTESKDHAWEDWRIRKAKKEDEKTELGKAAHASWEGCRAACLEHDDCFQFMWHNECCAMHADFKLGKPVKKEDKEKQRYISGWDVDKVKSWIAEKGDCGDRVEWPDVVKPFLEPSEGSSS